MSKSIKKPLAPTSDYAALYDRDFVLWLEQTVALLRQGKVHELDVTNLIEEISYMSRREKRSVKSDLKVVLFHLLKYKYQPNKRSRNWLTTLLEHRNRIADALEDSPSLRPYLQENFDKIYDSARDLASTETGILKGIFPVVSPFTFEQALDQTYHPD
ncbi:MAG: DUF29 domain-containing protein [Pseudanabaenaceae cyanobacterium]